MDILALRVGTYAGEDTYYSMGTYSKKYGIISILTYLLCTNLTPDGSNVEKHTGLQSKMFVKLVISKQFQLKFH